MIIQQALFSLSSLESKKIESGIQPKEIIKGNQLKEKEKELLYFYIIDTLCTIIKYLSTSAFAI